MLAILTRLSREGSVLTPVLRLLSNEATNYLQLYKLISP